MASTKLILQQPYKTAPARDKAEQQQDNESATDSTKTAKKRAKQLNPMETRLYLFLIFDRDRIVKIKTEYKILPEKWDFKNQGLKSNVAGSIEFNQDLEKLKTEVYDKYKELLKDFPDMTFSQVAQLLKEYGKTKEIPFLKSDKGFFEYLDEYMVYLKDEVAPGTIKKYVSIKNSLQEFVKTNRKYEFLTFSMIDHVFKDKYVNHLRNQEPRGRMKTRPEEKQKGVLVNTERKYIECLKTFLKWAEERKYNRYTTYQEFKPVPDANKKRQKQKLDIVTLTLPELSLFYNFNFPDNPEYIPIKDLWCFGAFTGQRWSDIERFEKSQLEGDIWTFEAFKTKKRTEIDLAGYAGPALDILKKYDYILPKIQLQKFNEDLKKAAEVAGIKKEIKIKRYVGANEIEIIKPKCNFLSSHSARKSCVSILLNDYNLNITHVMEITGHSDLKTLQKYINKDRTARRDAISKTKSINELPILKVKTA